MAKLIIYPGCKGEEVSLVGGAPEIIKKFCPASAYDPMDFFVRVRNTAQVL